MRHTKSTSSAPRVSELVLDPFAYSDILAPLVREGLLDHDQQECLAAALQTAVAQLDAVGDSYGAIALAEVLGQLTGLHAIA